MVHDMIIIGTSTDFVRRLHNSGENEGMQSFSPYRQAGINYKDNYRRDRDDDPSG